MAQERASRFKFIHRAFFAAEQAPKSFPPLPTTTIARRSQTHAEHGFDTATILREARDPAHAGDTVLYLAYGSNLAAQTFRDQRGIQPLSSINVLVPELELCFDLPGIPYKEPCFANTRYREEWAAGGWEKGLVGVVYEVTLSDYARIIATEGAGSSYQDITIDCYELPAGADAVDEEEARRRTPFKAHTLFAPAGARSTRPDPDYAEPSARYLKLLSNGAAENKLPGDYRAYLRGLQPYTITSMRQKLGQLVVITSIYPTFAFIMLLGITMSDEQGRAPAWVQRLLSSVSGLAWTTYDLVFKPLFGDGERTQGRRIVLEDVEVGASLDTKAALLAAMQ